MPNTPVLAAVTGLPFSTPQSSRREMLLGFTAGPAVAAFGSLHEAIAADADPSASRLQQFRTARAEYERALDAEQKAEKRFKAMLPAPPLWDSHKSHGGFIRMRVRGWDVRVLNWLSSGRENLLELIKHHEGELRFGRGASQRALEECQRELDEIDDYNRARNRASAQSGLVAAAKIASAKGKEVYDLAVQIIDPEPTTIEHLIAQAEVLSEGYDDIIDEGVSFYARVMKVLRARRELPSV